MIDLEQANPNALCDGFIRDESGTYTCVFCGRRFEEGEVFPVDGRYFMPRRAAEHHVAACHPDRFARLLNTDHKYLSLTENQKNLLSLFQAGVSDQEIAKRLGLSASTVRHQRFLFRERAKAARLYLAIWSMVENGKQQALLPVHEGATMMDERYVITEEENEKILGNVFSSLEPLRLKVFPAKEKKKIVILRKLAEQFTPGRTYTEQEVNGILKEIYEDFATLRRYLIEYGYLGRTDDCRSYWKP